MAHCWKFTLGRVLEHKSELYSSDSYVPVEHSRNPRDLFEELSQSLKLRAEGLHSVKLAFSRANCADIGNS